MKKLTVSAFALLAIVFALTSAFTSQKKVAMFDDAWFKIAATVDLDDFEDATGSTGGYDVMSTYVNSAGVATPIAETELANEGCEGSSEILCAVKFDEAQYGTVQAGELRQGDLDALETTLNGQPFQPIQISYRVQ
jgi:hypothetical protein